MKTTFPPHAHYRILSEPPNMNKIALAGGTSGVGHAFWDALEAQQAHAYILLTRKPIDNPKAVVVDYSDVDALKSVLEAQYVKSYSRIILD